MLLPIVKIVFMTTVSILACLSFFWLCKMDSSWWSDLVSGSEILLVTGVAGPQCVYLLIYFCPQYDDFYLEARSLDLVWENAPKTIIWRGFWWIQGWFSYGNIIIVIFVLSDKNVLVRRLSMWRGPSLCAATITFSWLVLLLFLVCLIVCL